jgi:putative ABC transport system permease protein
MMRTLWQDVRYGARMLRKQPTFTAVAVITLALGIGANSAIFSIVNSVLLRPLQLKEPDQLVRLYETLPQGGTGSVSFPNLKDWREQSEAFTGIAAYQLGDFNLRGPDHPERVNGATVSPDFFDVLEAPPALGRTFREGEDLPGNNRVVVLSNQLWKRNFGGDPAVVDKDIALGGENYTVIGVMPPDFRFPSASTALWVPIVITQNQQSSRGNHFLNTIARLKPGVTVEQAQRQMGVIGARLEQQYPDSQAKRNILVSSLPEETVARVRPALKILLGAVGFVLLIACTNVANLLLARATARRKEIAIRTALGAGRGRLVRQFLTESVMLSVLGGALGLLMSKWGVDGLVALSAGFLPRASEVTIDGRVVGFTLLLSFVTGIAFGLAPALQVSRTDVQGMLKEGGNAGSSGQRNWLRSFLVVAEVSLSLVLLIGAGLLIKSFFQLQRTESGLRPDNVLTMRVSLPAARYNTPQTAAGFYRQVLERTSALPGVESAAVVNMLPLQLSGFNGSVSVEGQPPPPPGQYVLVEFRSASADYFRALGIPLVAGRFFSEQDAENSAPVVIINQEFANKLFPNEDPIGKRIRAQSNDWQTVVGVVGNVKQWRLTRPPSPEVFIPYTQAAYAGLIQSMSLVVRGKSDPAPLAEALRQQVLAVDPNQPVYDVKTMEKIVADSMSDSRMNTMLLSIFAALAMVLAMIGIYSVMSYTVTQNTREIGIRMALGAQAGDVLKLVVGQGLALTFIGVAVGVAAAFGLTRLMSSLLYGVTATDPLTFVIVSAVLVSVAVASCYIPARRALRVDPIIALRYE